MPIPKTSVNLRAEGLRDTAYDLLLDAIVTGQLEPGSRLYDEELEARFGTTRSALRGALTELETQWLVRIVPRRGTFVTDFDLNRGLQAIEVATGVTRRAMLDAAARLTPEHLAALGLYRSRWLRTPETMREAIRTQQADGLYDVILEAAGNSELDRLRGWVLPYIKRTRWHLVVSGAVEPSAVLAAQRENIANVLAGDVAGAADSLWVNAATNEALALQAVAEPPKKRGVTLTRDLVADTIERAILDGTLQPDEPLPETDLMAWLGVSHTPIRQALDELANRGLVEQQINRPARVARQDPATIRQTFEAYGVLIDVAYRRAMQLDRDGLLAVLRPHHERYTLEPDAPVSEINAGINIALFEFSGAQVLLELHNRLASRLDWYLVNDKDPNIRFAARELVAATQSAIVANDVEAIDRIVKEAYERRPFLGG